jgi:hypothetical protein
VPFQHRYPNSIEELFINHHYVNIGLVGKLTSKSIRTKAKADLGTPDYFYVSFPSAQPVVKVTA